MEHHLHNGEAPSHGFKVGVATLAITRFYEQLLAYDFTALDLESCLAKWPATGAVEARIHRMFAGTDFISTAITETGVKHVSRVELRRELARLKAAWPGIRARLQAQLLPSAEMQRRLGLVGAPSDPEQIGITRERLRDSFFRAYHIRRRFTVLDVAVRTATLDTFLDGIFGPGAVWEIK
jgi:glycerol-1-phosphate dehydrogenase [NAD(P)+]